MKSNQREFTRTPAPVQIAPNHPPQALYQGVSLLTPYRAVLSSKNKVRGVNRDEIQSMRPSPATPQIRAPAPNHSHQASYQGVSSLTPKPIRSFPKTKNAAQPRANLAASYSRLESHC
jgi:hypothetical protein